MRKFATAKDLHIHAGDLLEEVRKGHEVIIRYRGQPFALLKPVTKAKEDSPLRNNNFFGMWKNRKDLQNVHKWIDKLRAPRYPR